MSFLTLSKIHDVRFFFTLTLTLLALDHLTTGILGVFAPRKARDFYQRLFGVSVPDDEQYTLLFRPWGALGVFAGLVGVLPIFDPERYAPILYALVILLIMRICMRFLFQRETLLHYNLSTRRNYIHIALIAASATIIILKLIQMF